MGKHGALGAVDAGSVFERIGRALAGLPQRRRLVLRPTPAGIMIDAGPAAVDPVSAPALVVIDSCAAAPPAPSTPLRLGAPVHEPVYELAPALASVPSPPEVVDVGGDVYLPREALVCDPMARLRAADAALVVKPAADHAMALLCRLQSDAETVGVVEYETIADIYADMVIELGWAPAKWATVSKHLSDLAGCRKRYVNGPNGKGKVRVYDIPHPGIDEIAEHFGASLDREIAHACEGIRQQRAATPPVRLAA
jgi:hypothetical protein